MSSEPEIDKLIEEFDEAKEIYCSVSTTQNYSEYQRTRGAIRNTLATLHTDLAAARARIAKLEEAARLIPVGERLPDNDRIVLVLCASGYLTKGWNVQADYWWVYDDIKGEFHPRRHGDLVTHWRELPPPPERQP